jgi:hypothetical protein
VANRDNHYEAAFEEYLRARGVPYVAVDEARRSLLSSGDSIKSLDFIVSAPGQVAWLVDVKGRRFPSGDGNKQYWKCFSKPHRWTAKREPHEAAVYIASRLAPTIPECHLPRT